MESQKHGGSCIHVCQVKHDTIKTCVKLEVVKMSTFLIAAGEGASRQLHATALLHFFVFIWNLPKVSDLKELKICDQCEIFVIFWAHIFIHRNVQGFLLNLK